MSPEEKFIRKIDFLCLVLPFIFVLMLPLVLGGASALVT